MGDVRPFPRSGSARRRRHEAVLPRERMPVVECAFCGGDQTEPASIYGCHMMTAQYYCRACRSVFDWVREESLGPEIDER